MDDVILEPHSRISLVRRKEKTGNCPDFPLDSLCFASRKHNGEPLARVPIVLDSAGKLVHFLPALIELFAGGGQIVLRLSDPAFEQAQLGSGSAQSSIDVVAHVDRQFRVLSVWLPPGHFLFAVLRLSSSIVSSSNKLKQRL